MKKYGLLLLITLLSACVGGTIDQWEGTNTLVMYMSSNPVTLNTVSASDVYAHHVHDLTFDSLVYTGSNLEPIPWVATNWTWNEEFYPGEWEEYETVIEGETTNTITNIMEGTVSNYILTFYMRDDVYWQDGEPFTAHDMVFTYEKIMDPVSKAVNKYPQFDGVVRTVTALDDYTLEVVYNQPLATAVPSWGIYPLPKHLYEQYETADEFHASEYNRLPVGNGPYYVKDWQTAKYIVLEKNTNYWGETPNFERIVYRIVLDDNTAHTAFRKGMFDLFEMQKEKYFNDKDEDYFVEGYNVYMPLNYGYSLIAWDCSEDSIFNDKRVRQAMTYSIDRETIAEELGYGLSIPISGPFVYGTWAYNMDVKPIPFDLDKAGQLLSEAGWEDTDGDGYLDKDGETFEFELMYVDAPVSTAIVVHLQENLAKLGAILNIRMQEWSVVNQSISTGDFDSILFGWSLGDDPDPYDIFHSSQIGVGVNINSYSNAVVDDLIIKGRREFDRDKRTELYHQIHELIAEDQPYSFLFASYRIYAATKSLRGITIADRGLVWWYPGIYNWYKVEISAE